MARGRKKNEDNERVDPFESGSNDAAAVLLDLIEQIEQKQGEIAETNEEIRELMREAGGRGYNTKVIRRVLAVRKAKRKNAELYEAEEHEFETYMSALGLSEY